MTTISRRDFVTSSATAMGFVLTKPLFAKADKIKIVQIGTAHSHAAGKMEALRKFPQVFDVVGVVEENEQLQAQAKTKSEFQGLAWLTREQVVNIKGLQAVVVETDVDDLLPTAQRCVEAGLHVHIDKPPGKSLTEFDAFLQAAKKRGLVVQLGYMFRYNPAFQFCLNAVKEDWLGTIFEVDGVISKTISFERRKNLVHNHGGSMMLLGCHLIDILIAVCGKPNKVTPFRRQTFPERDKMYDNELAVFEWPKTTATIRSALMEVDGWQRRQFVICGDRGSIETKPRDDPVLRLTLREPVGKFKAEYQTVALPKMTGRYDDQLLDFARTIRGEKEPAYSFEHDLNVHEAVLRASGIL